jgi:hypothetical protein
MIAVASRRQALAAKTSTRGAQTVEQQESYALLTEGLGVLGAAVEADLGKVGVRLGQAAKWQKQSPDHDQQDIRQPHLTSDLSPTQTSMHDREDEFQSMFSGVTSCWTAQSACWPPWSRPVFPRKHEMKEE